MRGRARGASARARGAIAHTDPTYEYSTVVARQTREQPRSEERAMPMATGVATPFPPFAQKYSVYFNFTRQGVRAQHMFTTSTTICGAARGRESPDSAGERDGYDSVLIACTRVYEWIDRVDRQTDDTRRIRDQPVPECCSISCSTPLTARTTARGRLHQASCPTAWAPG